MATIVSDCPRCGANEHTFDILGNKHVGLDGWQYHTEVFGICRACHKSTVFETTLTQQQYSSAPFFKSDNLFANQDMNFNRIVSIDGFISLRDHSDIDAPEHLPPDVQEAFEEGATCFTVQCWNAAGAMFRTCIDLASKGQLPEDETEGLNRQTRNNLKLRLDWLLKEGRIPSSLDELAHCIRDNGNDGVHEANLTQDDAEDLLDFTFILLERVFTEPQKVRLATERRSARRNSSQT